METHYQTLGVHNHSEPASIRAAYLALVKRYHPDARGNIGDTAAAELYRINIAYSVLRDPAKRAVYDAELLQSRLILRPPPRQDRRLPVVPVRKRRRRTGRLTALVVAVCLVLIVWDRDSLREQLMPDSVWHAPRASQNGTKAAVGSANELDVDPRVQDAVAFASEMPAGEALATSRRCFDEVDTYPSLSIADQCVAFDLAYASVHPAAQNEYFGVQSSRKRHYAALAFLGSAEDRVARLNAVANKTRSALLALATARSEGVLPPPYSATSFPQ